MKLLERTTSYRPRKDPRKKQGIKPLTFSIHEEAPLPGLLPYIDEVVQQLIDRGHQQVRMDKELNFVINLVNMEEPMAYHRKRPEEFVITFALLPVSTSDIKTACYRGLVKTLSNLFFGILPCEGSSAPQVYYVTPEVGFVNYTFDPKRIVKDMNPIIQARLMFRNHFHIDLPPSQEIDFQEADQFIRYGHKLNDLGLLPTPFPVHDILTEDLAQEIFNLYRIKGLSYGNFSIRAKAPYDNGHSFWMTARGVDKSNLQGVGKDILLVSGFDPMSERLQVNVPPDYDATARVSVDAIEHYMIYKNFPDVGAIVHVHAWMNGIPSTMQNHPCGSWELAREVTQLLKKMNNPNQAVIGLKNHGITVTGTSLEEIFGRIDGKLRTNVPML
jgi:ribulose-5-phosphate 4-epimerase/fuculose-1-phosphate aldolase